MVTYWLPTGTDFATIHRRSYRFPSVDGFKLFKYKVDKQWRLRDLMIVGVGESLASIILFRTAKYQWIGLRETTYKQRPHIEWENLWFPVDFPLKQSIEHKQRLGS